MIVGVAPVGLLLIGIPERECSFSVCFLLSGCSPMVGLLEEVPMNAVKISRGPGGFLADAGFEQLVLVKMF